MKTITRYLCLFALLALASLGLIACTKEQAKDAGQAVKSCAEAPETLACQVGVSLDCYADKCTATQAATKVLRCLTDCMSNGVGEGGSDAG